MSFTKLKGSAGGGGTRRLGTVTLTEDQTFRKSYETASWYQDVEVAAGTTAELTSNGYWAFAKFEGVKGSSLFVNRLFTSSSSKVDEGKGEADSYVVQMYAYDAAKAVALGTLLGGAEVKLDEGVAVLATQFEQSDGEVTTHFGFAVEETQQEEVAA